VSERVSEWLTMGTKKGHHLQLFWGSRYEQQPKSGDTKRFLLVGVRGCFMVDMLLLKVSE
jgi:hypothetical protein